MKEFLGNRPAFKNISERYYRFQLERAISKLAKTSGLDKNGQKSFKEQSMRKIFEPARESNANRQLSSPENHNQ